MECTVQAGSVPSLFSSRFRRAVGQDRQEGTKRPLNWYQLNEKKLAQLRRESETALRSSNRSSRMSRWIEPGEALRKQFSVPLRQPDLIVNLNVLISWQAQHFVNLEVQISRQAQHFVNLGVQFSFQVQRFVNLEVQISWQSQHFEPRSADFVAGAALCEPRSADFMAVAAL